MPHASSLECPAELHADIDQTPSWGRLAAIVRDHARWLPTDEAAELSQFADLLESLAELE